MLILVKYSLRCFVMNSLMHVFKKIILAQTWFVWKYFLFPCLDETWWDMMRHDESWWEMVRQGQTIWNTISVLKAVWWNILMRHRIRNFDEKFDETYWCYSVMRHFSEQFWQDILRKNYDKKFYWDISMRNFMTLFNKIF